MFTLGKTSIEFWVCDKMEKELCCDSLLYVWQQHKTPPNRIRFSFYYLFSVGFQSTCPRSYFVYAWAVQVSNHVLLVWGAFWIHITSFWSLIDVAATWFSDHAWPNHHARSCYTRLVPRITGRDQPRPEDPMVHSFQIHVLSLLRDRLEKFSSK